MPPSDDQLETECHKATVPAAAGDCAVDKPRDPPVVALVGDSGCGARSGSSALLIAGNQPIPNAADPAHPIPSSGVSLPDSKHALKRTLRSRNGRPVDLIGQDAHAGVKTLKSGSRGIGAMKLDPHCADASSPRQGQPKAPEPLATSSRQVEDIRSPARSDAPKITACSPQVMCLSVTQC